MATQQGKLATSTLDAFSSLTEDEQRKALSGMSDEVKKQLLTELQSYKPAAPTRSTPLSVLKETFWDPYRQMGEEFTNRIGDELVSGIESTRNIREKSLLDRGIAAAKLGTASFRVPAGILKDVVTGLPGALYDQGYKAAYEVGSDDPVEVAAGMTRALTLAGGLKGLYKTGRAGAGAAYDAVRDPNRIRPEPMPTTGVLKEPLLVEQPKWKKTFESGIRPVTREARTRLFEQLDEAVPEFIKSEVLDAGGKTINDIDGAIAVGERAGKRIYSEELGPHIEQLTEAIDLTPVADKLKAAIPANFTESAKKAMTKKIDDTFRGKKLNGTQIEDLRQALTAADRINAAMNNIDQAAVRKIPKGWFEGTAKDAARDFLAESVMARTGVDIRAALRKYGSVKELTQMFNGEIPIEGSVLDNLIGRGYVSGTAPNIRGRLAEATAKAIRSNDRMIRRGFDQYRIDNPYKPSRVPDPNTYVDTLADRRSAIERPPQPLSDQISTIGDMSDPAAWMRRQAASLLPFEEGMVANPDPFTGYHRQVPVRGTQPPVGSSIADDFTGTGMDPNAGTMKPLQPGASAYIEDPRTGTVAGEPNMLPGANEALPETPFYPGKTGVVKEIVQGPDGKPVAITRDYRRQTQLFETNPNRANPMPEGTKLAFVSRGKDGAPKYHYRTPQGTEIVTDFEVPQSRTLNTPPPEPGTSWKAGGNQPLNVPQIEGFELKHVIHNSRGDVTGYVYRNLKTGIELRSKKPLSKPPSK